MFFKQCAPCLLLLFVLLLLLLNYIYLGGVSGVFEIEDLVQVLEKNNASNIFVVSIPTNIRYVDYIVIASGRSQKHLMSIAEFVHKLFKVKCNRTDSIPRILNKKPLDWIALDIGELFVID